MRDKIFSFFTENKTLLILFGVLLGLIIILHVIPFATVILLKLFTNIKIETVTNFLATKYSFSLPKDFNPYFQLFLLALPVFIAVVLIELGYIAIVLKNIFQVRTIVTIYQLLLTFNILLEIFSKIIFIIFGKEISGNWNQMLASLTSSYEQQLILCFFLGMFSFTYISFTINRLRNYLIR